MQETRRHFVSTAHARSAPTPSPHRLGRVVDRPVLDADSERVALVELKWLAGAVVLPRELRDLAEALEVGERLARPRGDLGQIQPGMNEESVRMSLGTPDTTSALPGGNAFYYISSTAKQSGFMKEEEVDRRVVAVYFNQVGSVEKVAHYGMKDGRVFDYAKGETPADAGHVLAIGSLGDYPLRGPALACVLVCAGLWAAARPEPATRDDPVSRPAA